MIDPIDPSALPNYSGARIVFGFGSAPPMAMHADPSPTVHPAAYTRYASPLAQPAESDDSSPSRQYDIAVTNTMDAIQPVPWLQDSWLRCYPQDYDSVEIDILFTWHGPNYIRLLSAVVPPRLNPIPTSHVFVSIFDICCAGLQHHAPTTPRGKTRPISTSASRARSTGSKERIRS